MSTIETSITQAKLLANSTGNMIVIDVTVGSLTTRISVYPDNVKEGDEVVCDKCWTTCIVGENHECLTCDKCGDNMSVSSCLGTAECCFNYENICHNCAIWDNDKDKVICEDCQYQETTIVKGITCNLCGHDLPEMTMADHLAGKFNKKCPHKPKMTLNDYLWSKDARNPRDGTPMPVNYPHM